VENSPVPSLGAAHPLLVFGTIALFLLAFAAISLWFGVLDNRVPLARHGQITLVHAGYMVLMVAVPFAIFSLIYAEMELGASRVFQESPTRLHLVCTFLAVLDAVRVYISWAPPPPGAIPTPSRPVPLQEPSPF